MFKKYWLSIISAIFMAILVGVKMLKDVPNNMIYAILLIILHLLLCVQMVIDAIKNKFF